MHQPSGLTVPSTVWQAFGAVKSLQLLHFCSPFGVSWYLTTVCAILAACAGWLAAASIVAAPLAQIALPNKERLEISADVMLRTFVMVVSLELITNGDSRKTLDPAHTSALSATLENCRDGVDQTPMLDNRN
jgi:hypothetical protein